MSDSNETSPKPKSIRHKQVLDLAAKHPDATCEEIAAEIPSATADLVDRVLEKYGDPAAGEDEPESVEASPSASTSEADAATQDDTTEADVESSSDTPGERPSVEGESVPDPEELTPKERKTLRLIHEHPDATQREIADLLDVSTPTVNTRVNAIAGFDWESRRAFTTEIFESKPVQSGPSNEELRADGATGTEEEIETAPTNDEGLPTDADATADASTIDEAQLHDRFRQLSSQLSTIESHLDDLASGSSPQASLDDPELVQKVIHACVHSDTISEEEELRLLRELIQ